MSEEKWKQLVKQCEVHRADDTWGSRPHLPLSDTMHKYFTFQSDAILWASSELDRRAKRIAELEAYTERLRGASSQTSNVDYLNALEAENARLKGAVEWAMDSHMTIEELAELIRRASGEKGG